MAHLLSDDGSLAVSPGACWEKLVSHSRHTKSSTSATTASAAGDAVTAWACVPDVGQWMARGDVVTEEEARSAVERCFDDMAHRSLVPPLERMFQAAEKMQSDGALPSTMGAQLRHQMVSAVFAAPESLATIALVDASVAAAASQRSHGGGGVSLLPAHMLHTLVDAYTVQHHHEHHFHNSQSALRSSSGAVVQDDDQRSPLASFHAASSPRRTLRTPPPSATTMSNVDTVVRSAAVQSRAPRPIVSNRVLGFEITSLSQRVVNTMAPLVSHWVFVGSASDCVASLRSLSRSIAALRAADAPVAAQSETNVSLLIVGSEDDHQDGGLAAKDRIASMSAVIASASPTIVPIVSAAPKSSSPTTFSRRNESLHHLLGAYSGGGGSRIGEGGGLLAALRTVAWHTRALCIDVPKRRDIMHDRAALPIPTPLTLQLVHAMLMFSGTSASSSLLATDVIVESLAVVTAELHRFVLCSGLELLSRNALLSGRYGSVNDVETMVRKASHSAFQDVCAPLCPRQSVVDALDDVLAQVSRTTLNELEVETYHIAQHGAAAAVRGMANQLTDEDVAKLIKPAEWTATFESCVLDYLEKPLMAVAPLTPVAMRAGVDVPDENILMRSWSVQAKRSAMIDILCKWYLPNAKLLFAGDAERAQLRHKQVDGALRSAYQKQSDLEGRVAAEAERLRATTAQLARVHAAADTLQETNNKLQRALVEMQASTNAQLRLIKAHEVETNFLLSNKTSKRLDEDDDFANDDSSSRSGSNSSSASANGDHDALAPKAPTPKERLYKTVESLLVGIEGCLKLLGSPTHGLLIDAAKGIVIQRPPALSGPSNSARSTPNVSMVYNMNSSVTMNKSNGVVRSPERRRDGGGGRHIASGHEGFKGDIQAARRRTADERQQQDALNMSKQPGQAPQAAIVALPPSPISPTLIALPSPTARGFGFGGDDGLERQEARVHASMTTVLELQQRAMTLKDQLTASQLQSRTLDGKLRDALMDVASLRDDLHDLDVAYESVRKELQLSNTHLTTERGSHETTSLSLQERNEEVRHMQGLLDAEAIRVQHLEADISALRMQLADGSVAEERTRVTLKETERRVEVLTVESNMHASSAQQLGHQVAQLEKTLLHERTEKRETIHRYEHRVQELLSKLDETVSRYETVLTTTATEAASRIDALTVEISEAREAHRSADHARVSTGSELDVYKRELSELSSKHDVAVEERDDLRRRFEQLEENHRALELRFRIQADDVFAKDAKLASMREELQQSKQARAMLVHSMDSLNLFIEEQRVLSGDDYRDRPVYHGTQDGNVDGAHSLLDMNYTATTTSRSTTVPRSHAYPPEGMSMIRNSTAVESIARDDSHTPGSLAPKSTPVEYYAPLRELPHNVSTGSARAPISLTQLMHECPSDAEPSAARQSPPATTFAPVYIPPAAHNRSAGARPLGPHLQALAAIDTILDGRPRH